MGYRLLSETCLRASDEVIVGLEGVYKLLDDLIIVNRVWTVYIGTVTGCTQMYVSMYA